jgi:hypothetical protein
VPGLLGRDDFDDDADFVSAFVSDFFAAGAAAFFFAVASDFAGDFASVFFLAMGGCSSLLIRGFYRLDGGMKITARDLTALRTPPRRGA